jgi:hypothetical protein
VDEPWPCCSPPIATPVAATGAGRSLFFAMERSRAWQVPAEDAHRLLLDFAQAPGHLSRRGLSASL